MLKRRFFDQLSLEIKGIDCILLGGDDLVDERRAIEVGGNVKNQRSVSSMF